ncbi:MAG: hypothetical protein M1816_005238, partial [Peltula sp. TS41687]
LDNVGSVATDVVTAEANGTGAKERKETRKQIRCFTNNPLSFLQEWLAVKRKEQNFVHTPMGYLCEGRQLRANHPFFVASRALAVDECAGLDLGGATRASHGGIASGSGDDNAGYESDGSVDEDADVEFGDNIDGYLRVAVVVAMRMRVEGAVDSIISRAHSVMNGMSRAEERGGVVTC